jgi:hypothetical protein
MAGEVLFPAVGKIGWGIQLVHMIVCYQQRIAVGDCN